MVSVVGVHKAGLELIRVAGLIRTALDLHQLHYTGAVLGLIEAHDDTRLVGERGGTAHGLLGAAVKALVVVVDSHDQYVVLGPPTC